MNAQNPLKPSESSLAFTGVSGRNQLNPVFCRDGEANDFPLNTLPQGESLPETAYQIVHDEAMLDGNSRLNLATFVGTWMDEHAQRIYAESADKNMVDKDEYPQTAAIETRCWMMLADLWNAPDANNTIGTSTIGSSEACMLGGLALKRRWQLARRAEGLDTAKPNIVLSSAVQVCWEKFCNYWEVEARYVPVSADHPTLDGDALDRYVDENTIGVVAIMGVTYTGAYEPVEQISAALDRIQAGTGLDIPIHVDGASGAM
ncbi:MAG: glutamate decarboxylase, partial [Subtercola sp.]|nr:glutamate decarboxylase [Subtercola sp.]